MFSDWVTVRSVQWYRLSEFYGPQMQTDMSHPGDNPIEPNRGVPPRVRGAGLPKEKRPVQGRARKTLDTVGPATNRNVSSPTPKPITGAGPGRDSQLPSIVHSSVCPPADLRQRINRNRRPLSSILLSVILHVSVFVVMAMMVLQRPMTPTISFEAEVVAAREPDEPMFDVETIEVNVPDESESPVEMEFDDVADDAEPMESEDANSQVQLPSEFEQPSEVRSEAPEAPSKTVLGGGGLKGRSAQSRARLAATRGGSKASEAAVEQGLRWIIDHQNSNGSWYLMHHRGPCIGQCGDPGTKESPNAATGLALLALLGAGYTHQSGPYQPEMHLAVNYLVHRIKQTPHGGSLVDDSMYAHGIATIALAEAYQMTKDESLKEPVAQAVQYIISAQHAKGGWRYVPGQPGDMTVTGWQIMALKSGRMAGIEVPQEVLDRAQAFVDSLGESGGAYYGYQDNEKQPACTAIGLLSQMYLGWPREKAALSDGTTMLLDQGPSKSNVYYNYYAAQVLNHVGGDDWKQWNRTLRDYLVKTQDQRGHQQGSWFFRDQHGNVGGRLYTTAMCVMTLEVYYRYLPLYDDIGIEP